MHSLVRRFLKTAILFLATGLVIGVVMLVRREWLGVFPGPYTSTAHAHAILVGFVMLMILGVAAWMFPRPAKGDVSYRPGVAEAAYWCLTIGTAVRIAGELWRAVEGSILLRLAVMLGGVAQAVGILLFFWTMWGRIRPAGSQTREGQGERF
jgi:cbb3-type cytochrome oxidase subunit 1